MSSTGIREPNEADWELYRKHGIEGLRELQFWGTLEAIENYFRRCHEKEK
jgi:hypothetical protein